MLKPSSRAAKAFAIIAVAAVGLLMPVSSSFGSDSSGPSPQHRAEADPKLHATTTALLQAAAAADQTPIGREQLRRIAQERYLLMLEAREENPGGFLLAALPQEIREQLPRSVQPMVEQHVNLQGTVQRILWMMANNTPRVEQFLSPSKGPDRLYHLHFAQPTQLKSGAVVQANGVGLGKTLVFQGGGADLNLQILEPPPPIEIRRIIIIIGKFNGQAAPITREKAKTLGNIVGKFYKAASFGKVTFEVADVAGPFTVSAQKPNAPLNMSQYTSQAMAAGYNLTDYDGTVYLMPDWRLGGANGALGAAIGSVAFISASAAGSLPTYGHELGHNLGLSHAGTPGNEYGDKSSLMGGGGFVQPNGLQKVCQEWIPQERIVSLDDPEDAGTRPLKIQATEITDEATPQALQLYRSGSDDYITVSLRAPIGCDANLSSTFTNRISVHTERDNSGYTTLRGTFGPGESYNISGVGKVTFNSRENDKANLTVFYAGPKAVERKPAVSCQFNGSIPGAPNTPRMVRMTVVNRDNRYCEPTTFAIQGLDLPAGWDVTAVTPPQKTAPSGGISRFYIIITPPAGTLPGSYPLKIQAVDVADPNHAGSKLVSMAVTPDTAMPSLGVSAPTSGAVFPAGLITKIPIVFSVSDFQGVDRVEIFVNGVLKKIERLTPDRVDLQYGYTRFECSSTLDVKLKKGWNTLRFVAYDYSENNSEKLVKVIKK